MQENSRLLRVLNVDTKYIQLKGLEIENLKIPSLLGELSIKVHRNLS